MPYFLEMTVTLDAALFKSFVKVNYNGNNHSNFTKCPSRASESCKIKHSLFAPVEKSIN